MTDASTEAVTALIQEIVKRHPNQRAAILAATDSYVRVIRGAAGKPKLSAEQIADVGREVLDGWAKQSFPRAGDFMAPVTKRIAARIAARGKHERQRTYLDRVSECIATGKQAWRWQSNPVNGPAWERDYQDMKLSFDDATRRAIEALLGEAIDRMKAQGIEPHSANCTDRLRGKGTFKSLSDAIGGHARMQDAAE